MVVMGEVHPDRMFTNAGACAGDVLVLTKPLGTGILTTALKRDALIEAGMVDAVRSMTALNDGAAKAALRVGVSAATDVTGFGLLRHLGNMLAASRVAAEVAFEALPLLPHALNLAARGIVPAGPSGISRRPRTSTGPTTWPPRADALRGRADLRRAAARRSSGERGRLCSTRLREAAHAGRGRDRPARRRARRPHPRDPPALAGPDSSIRCRSAGRPSAWTSSRTPSAEACASRCRAGGPSTSWSRSARHGRAPRGADRAPAR